MKNNFKKIFVVLIFLILVLIIFLLFKYKIIEININNRENSKIEYEIEKTKLVNSTTNGVYITDVSNVVENVMPSIVSITSKVLVSSGRFGPYYSQNQYSEGAGSGIIISKTDTELLILTNNHVVEGATDLVVQFINGENYDAKIKGTSIRHDIAVISVILSDMSNSTLDSIKVANIGSSDDIKVGSGIIAIGNALGYGQSVTTGVISAINREVTIDDYTNKMIQIDAAINGGNSGGALLNSNGEVIGINSAKYSSNGSSTSVEGMGFAIPISDVMDIIDKLLIGKDDTSNITLGIEGYIITLENSKLYNMPVGFYITGIMENSIASSTNLSIGNIITKVNGNDILTIGDLKNILYDLKVGDNIILNVEYIDNKKYLEKEIKIIIK